MLLPYQAVLANQSAMLPANPIDQEYIVRFTSGTEDENDDDAFCVYFGGETGGAGTLDASVANLPIETTPPLVHADGAIIASMTQIAAPGSVDELKFCEFTGGRIRVRASTTVVAGGDVSIVLMANRPFAVEPA